MRVNIVMDWRWRTKDERVKYMLKATIEDAIAAFVQSVTNLGRLWRRTEVLFDLPNLEIVEEQSMSFALRAEASGKGASKSFVRIVVEP